MNNSVKVKFNGSKEVIQTVDHRHQTLDLGEGNG
jgi:hypothetical protein